MPIRWGIIGCGDVVKKRVARAIIDNPDSELVAACRRNGDALRAFCDEFGVKRAYSRDSDLIADDGIDAVYISTPVNLHLPQTIEAAAHGKHILVEKPMALSVDECDQMIAACRANGVKLGVAFYRRFYPAVQRIKEIIEAGEIGNVLSVSAVTATPFAFGPKDDGYWRVIPSQGGGGPLMDIGSHRINVLQHLFGEILDVRAFCDTLAAGYESEDCASAIFRFANGVHGTLQCHFGTPVDPDELTITATKARITCSPLNEGNLVIDYGNERQLESLPPSANFNLPLIADFNAAICEDRQPMVDGKEGRLANEVMQRAYQAAEKGV